MLDSVLGLEAPEFIAQYVAGKREIAEIKVFRPQFFPALQDVPGLSMPEQALAQRGLELRAKLGLSFWDSTLLILSTEPMIADKVLKLATRHNNQDIDHQVIPRDACTGENLRQIMTGLHGGKILTVSSRVRISDGSFRHIPMIDFHCSEADQNLEAAKIIVKELGLRGSIARSGASYHFYGSDLVDENSLISMLGKSLLFSPIVDHRWVAHQLLERACGLRISPGKQYRRCPEIVASI